MQNLGFLQLPPTPSPHLMLPQCRLLFSETAINFVGAWPSARQLQVYLETLGTLRPAGHDFPPQGKETLMEMAKKPSMGLMELPWLPNSACFPLGSRVLLGGKMPWGIPWGWGLGYEAGNSSVQWAQTF